MVVVISAHSSDSSCPLARETIYQNAGGRPLSQTIRNRYRSHYHFIAEILGRVMVPQRERERDREAFSLRVRNSSSRNSYPDIVLLSVVSFPLSFAIVQTKKFKFKRDRIVKIDSL